MTGTSNVDSFDALARDLQESRCSAGMPSYAEIARRIGDARASDGIPSAAARPARSTVYDAFRTGRSRMNPDLLAEIVLALGRTESEADRWRQRCQRLRAATETPQPAVRSAPSEPARTARQDTPEPVAPEADRSAFPSEDGAPHTRDDVPAATPEGNDARPLAGPSAFLIGLAVNALGYYTVGLLHLPVYLDMIGTGFVAITLGPWWGVLLAGMTNILGTTLDGTAALPFFVVSATGALVWGYGAQIIRRRPTISKFLGLNVLVALVCSLISTPLGVFMFRGDTAHNDYDVLAWAHPAQSLMHTGPLLSNLAMSMTDKLLSGFLILVLLEATRRRPSPPAPQPRSDPPRQELVPDPVRGH